MPETTTRSDIDFLLNKRDAWRFSALFAILAVGALLEVFALASVPLFVTMLLQTQQHDSETATASIRLFCNFLETLGMPSQTPVARICAAGALVLLLNAIWILWTLVGMWLQYRMQSNRRIELSQRLLTDYLQAPPEFHGENNSAELLNRVVVECDNVIQGTVSPILEFVRGGTMAVCIAALLFWYAPAMTTAALGLVALSCAAVLLVRNKRLKRLSRQEQLGRSAALMLGSEALLGRVEAHLYACRNFFEERFRRNMKELATAQGGNMLQIRATWPMLEFLCLAALLLVTTAALVLTNGDFVHVAPQIALLAMALMRLKSTAVNLMQASLEFRRYRPALTRVCHDLRVLEGRATAKCTADAEDATPPLTPFPEVLRMDGVSFAYPNAGGEKTLSEISLEIHTGEAVAIVGATGCGKSTLLKLLLGLLKPQEGEIRLDGKSLGDEEVLFPWRHAIGYVPQKPFLLDATLMENIALGVPSEKRDGVAGAEAVAAAQLEEVVSTLPQGLDTPLGEGACRLSGGQAQRVALARALYRRPQCLILDEATSALDPATEAAFVNALTALHGKITTITVTHRISSVQNCDRIFFLVNGRLEATGKYETLQKNSPKFRAFASAGEQGLSS